MNINVLPVLLVFEPYARTGCSSFMVNGIPENRQEFYGLIKGEIFG